MPKSRPFKRLTTVDEVVEALGGATEVARFTKRTLPAVGNWKRFGRFPSTLYFVMRDRLKSRRCIAPRTLWAFENLDGPAQPEPELAAADVV